MIEKYFAFKFYTEIIGWGIGILALVIYIFIITRK